MKVIEIVTGDGEKFVCEASEERIRTFSANYGRENQERLLRDHPKEVGIWLTFTPKEMPDDEFYAIPATNQSAKYFATQPQTEGVNT